jgi:hypothetical protein
MVFFGTFTKKKRYHPVVISVSVDTFSRIA